MQVFKCKMCGGTLNIEKGTTVAECEFCGRKQTIPNLDDEKRATLYDRANHFRRTNDYDKAMGIYEIILNENKTDAEAYWSILLCKYGVEYVEDPVTRKRVPTINRTQFTSITKDEDYKNALKYADGYQRDVYQAEAKEIDQIQKGILAISGKEEPFDIFICYKETDSNGRRTIDSVLAQDLYYNLKNEGFKVFFSRITLEDKLGVAYEPYIFAALNSAKVMIVIGSKPEYLNAVWVKNEWSRYLSLIKSGKKKTLIPAYKDMEPYDLPEEFSHLQAQDMNRLGFMQDLLYGIKKIIGKTSTQTVIKETVVVDNHHDSAPLLRRAYLFLEDGDFESADEYAEKVLDANPECSEAYFVKLLIDLELQKPEALLQSETPITNHPNYKKAVRFADEKFGQTLSMYSSTIASNIDNKRKEGIYQTACTYVEDKLYDEAIETFAQILDYKDSALKREECQDLVEEAHKNIVYKNAIARVSYANVNDVAMKQSINDLQSIIGYSDSEQKIAELQARLEKYYSDKKIAEEKARIKAEEERLRLLREAELRRIKNEKKKRLIKKVSKISALCVASLTAILVIVFSFIIPTIRYNTASKLVNNGEYDKAMAIYQDIGGYYKSDDRLTVLEGVEKILKSSSYEDGIRTILSVGVPVKISYDLTGGNMSGTTTASFDLSNGVHLTSNSNANTLQDYTYNSYDEFTSLKTAYRTGYHFTGWKLEEHSYKLGDAFEMKLSAQWASKNYSVVYQDVQAVYDSVTIKFNNIYDGSIPSSITMTHGQKLEYPTVPTRTGYAFAGWYTNSACTIPYYFEGDIKRNMSLYAKWVPMVSSYTSREYVNVANHNSLSNKKEFDNVTATSSTNSNAYYFTCYSKGTYKIFVNHSAGDFVFDLYNESKGSTYESYVNLWSNRKSYSKEFTAEAGDVISIRFRKFGSTSSTGKGYFYVTGANYPTSTATVKKDTILRYDYVKNAYTTATVSYNEPTTLITPTRTGYNFAGWYNGNKKVESGVWDIASNVTLTPLWQAKTNTITLEACGGAVLTNKISVVYEQSYTLPTPTREGYTFLGWYNGDTQYFSSTWMGFEDITLTAQWLPNTYLVTYDDVKTIMDNVVVTYNYNYSGSTSSTVTLENGQTLNYPTVPTRSGYAFAGWYTDSSCSTAYNFSGTITSDITLYAKWVSMTSSYSSREYIDIANYNSSSNKKIISTNSSSNLNQNYYYFTCYTSGTYTLYASYYAGDFYITGYNATNGTTILSQKNLYSNNPSTSATFTANAGDVIYLSLYKYGGSGSTGKCTIYMAGASYPTSTATANSNIVTGCDYDTSSTFSTNVTFGELHTLPIPTRTGYSFLGWYNGNTKVESGNWSIASNVTLTPRWQAGGNTITLDANGGEVTPNYVAVTYNQSYTLPTPTKEGYTFDGWYNENIKYVGGTWTGLEDITLTAKWTANTYTVTYNNTKYLKDKIVVTYDYNYSGSTPTTTTLTNGQLLNSTTPYRSGFVFTGWYLDSTCYIRYAFDEPITDDLTLYAGWKSVSFTNAYSTTKIYPYSISSSNAYEVSTSGTSESSRKYLYFVAEESGTHSINWKNSTSSTYSAYYLNVYNLTTGESICNTTIACSTSYSLASFNCSSGDVIVINLFRCNTSYYSTAYLYFTGFNEPATSTATAICSDVPSYAYEVGSTVTTTATYGSMVTLPTLSREGYTFLGWFNASKQVQSGLWSIPYNTSLIPKWEEIHYTRDGDYIYFGRFPQTIKADAVTVSSTPNASGYYLGSDGCEYAKVVADPESGGYTFSNGTSLVDGTVYYFKVEPIRWKIIREIDGTAIIVCDSIIASRAFDADSNNYKESELRAWLNNEFYNTAFDSYEKTIIQTTLVDNSAQSTGESVNSNACENTQDKIYLLSFDEISDIDSKEKSTSDYAKASGVWSRTDSSYAGNGCWWLRSPNSENTNSVTCVDSDGCIRDCYDVYRVDIGVVPVLKIKL